MENLKNFTEQDIPYGILEKFGLSQQMIDDLPQTVMYRLLAGKDTPILPVYSTTERGEKIRSYARISLVRNEDGKMDVCFAPRWNTSELEEYTMVQRQVLLDGDVTTAEIPGRGLCYIQFDDVINQVMSVPVDIVNQNISILVKNKIINKKDEEILHEGKPLQFPDLKQDEQITVGIDLREMAGIRMTRGDLRQWRAEKNSAEMPKYSFGMYGCWIADSDNNLTYVLEDDYTEEIKTEQQRIATANAAKANIQSMSQPEQPLHR